MSYTDVFGGSTLQAAQVAYRAVALSADVTLVWPQFATDSNYVARLMNVTASTAGLSITFPDATLVSPGEDCFVRNIGSNSFTVLDADGGVIATLSAGDIRYIYLTDNSTTAGTWSAILFGVGTSSVDAGQLAGEGLKAIGNTLAFAPVTTSLSADYDVLTTDRAKVFVWTGGSGTITLPDLADVTPDFQIGVRNQGTGTLTVTTGDGSQIDGAADISLQVTESAFCESGATAWYTVGRGRNTQFNFTKLAKTVTGGTDTLTLTEAANVVQVFSGALTTSEIVVEPAIIQVYYVINSTTGAHTLTVKTPVVGGSTVSIDQGEAAILFCDGSNIINCTTSGATSINATIPAGAVGAPSLKFAPDPTTGIYQPTTGQFAVAISGVRRLLITATGINGTVIGATTPANGSFTNLVASTTAALPIGATIGGYGLRAKLTGALALYVNEATGNDANSGLSSITAFATLQKAANVAEAFDLGGYAITVHVADGTYTAGALQAVSEVGQNATSNIVWLGNTGTPGNVIVQPASGACFQLVGQGYWTVKGMRLISATDAGLRSSGAGSFIDFSDIEFGACAIAHMAAAVQGAIGLGLGNYAIIGSSASHISVGEFSYTFPYGSYNVTVPGGLTFTQFAECADGYLDATGAVYSSTTATGVRANAILNGIINTSGGGANFFPGNAANTTDTGGRIV